MARKSKNINKSARAQVRNIEKSVSAQTKIRQRKERDALRARQKKEKENLKNRQRAERQRIKEFRKAGAALKKKKVQGFTSIDWRKAVPTAVFKATGKTGSKLEKSIARLNDAIAGLGKLVTVKDKKKREELRQQGAIVHGNKVLVQKDQYVPKKGPVTIKREIIGKVMARINPENLDEEIREFFEKYPDSHVAIQLGSDAYPLYTTFDDADSLIGFLETNFSSMLAKEVIDEIVLVPASQLNTVRQKVGLARKRGMSSKRGQKILTDKQIERKKTREKEASRRYRQRRKATKGR